MSEKGQHVVLPKVAAIELVAAMAAFAEILSMEHDREQALARARQDDPGKRGALVEVVSFPEQAGNTGLFHDLVGLLVVRQALERIQHVRFLDFPEECSGTRKSGPEHSMPYSRRATVR